MASCIRCGKNCNDGETMCFECRAWFQQKTGDAFPDEKSQKEKKHIVQNIFGEKKKYIIIAAVVLVVLFIAVLSFGKKEGTDIPPSNDVSENEEGYTEDSIEQESDSDTAVDLDEGNSAEIEETVNTDTDEAVDIGTDTDENVDMGADEDVDTDADVDMGADEDVDTDADVDVNADVNVEEQILFIREIYNDIVASMNSGEYTKVVSDEGISIYYDGSEVRAVVVPRDFSGNQYTQSYYYDENGLFFAYYEAEDAHRFYFMNNQLIRWRYSSNATDAQNAENHDLEQSEEYHYWNLAVKAESDSYIQSFLENGGSE